MKENKTLRNRVLLENYDVVTVTPLHHVILLLIIFLFSQNTLCFIPYIDHAEVLQKELNNRNNH